MRKGRKHYTGEEKVAILRRHLLDKVPVSDLCEISEELCQVEDSIFSTGPPEKFTSPPQFSHTLLTTRFSLLAYSDEGNH